METSNTSVPLLNECSIFEKIKNVNNPKYDTVKNILESFRTDIYKKDIEKIRQSVFDKHEKSIINTLKGQLKCFTLSGKFKHRKANTNLSEKLQKHTGFFQIDIDNIEQQDIKNLIDKLSVDNYFVFFAKSPSGNGLKSAFYIDEIATYKNIEDIERVHTLAFNQIYDYIKNNYEIEIDKSVKDVGRLFFVTYDPDMIINDDFKSFPFNNEVIDKSSSDIELVDNDLKKDDSIIIDTNNSTDKKYGKREINQIINNAVKIANTIINNSYLGNRHSMRLKAGYLLGGLVGANLLSETEAIDKVKFSVQNNTTDYNNAISNLLEAIKEGAKNALNLEKEITLLNNRNHKLIQNEAKDLEKIKYQFWKEKYTKEVRLEIVIDVLYQMYKDSGYAILKLESNDEKNIFIKNNIVEEMRKLSNLRKYTNDYIDSLPVMISNLFNKYHLKETFSRGLDQYINQNKFEFFAKRRYIHEFISDTSDCSYVFYKNCYLEIKGDGIVPKSYDNLKGLIWKSQIIQRNFSLIQDKKEIAKSDFYKFLKNIVTDKNKDIHYEDRFLALLNTIGYLLHSYNIPDKAWAIIFTEANLDNEAKGRTGKGLIMRAIGHIRKVTKEDGKQFNKVEDKFLYQSVNLDTKVFFIDDVDPKFSFKKLFSSITEGMKVEKKWIEKFDFSPHQTPKIVISSNYAIEGLADSYLDRRKDIELLTYYNANHKPKDDFKKLFFDEWDEKEWNVFDNLMIMCLNMYLKNGKNIPNYSSDTITYRQLLYSTNSDFLDYVNNNLELNTYISVNDFFNGFQQYTEYEYKDITKNKLSKYLQEYCKANKLNYENKTHKKSDGKTEKAYYISKKVTNIK